MIGTKTTPAREKTLSWIALTLIFANIGLLLTVVLALSSFGAIGPALAYLRGDRLVADAYARSLGTVEEGEEHAAFFKLTNMSSKPIKILGARSSCICLVLDQLPVVLPPRGIFSLRVRLRRAKKAPPGPIAEIVTLFTDRQNQAQLTLKINGYARESGESLTTRPEIQR